MNRVFHFSNRNKPLHRIHFPATFRIEKAKASRQISQHTGRERERERERVREMKGSMIRKKVERKCKIRGYILKVEALEEILSFVERFPGAEDDAVDLLLDQLDLDSRNLSLLSPFPFPCSAFYTLRF